MVTIKDEGTGKFMEDASLCDGSSLEIRATTSCNIPIKSLRLGHSDFDYQLADIPQFKVSAYNARGYGQESVANTGGAAIQTEPSQMEPVERNSATTEKEIILDWQA